MGAEACPQGCPLVPGVATEHRFVVANGIRFHCVEAGSAGAPLVLLLHGFPEFWYSWRHQIPALAERFRVAAPDLRGYNLTERPSGGYDLPNLVRDAAELVAALGAERASIVGHDWGGVIAWALAMWAPERVERLAILNAPHPAAYLRELRHSPSQRLRSWYVLFFQIPGLAERLMRLDDCRIIGEMLRRTAVAPEAFSEADLAEYRRAACRPGALAAGLAYYRSLGRFGLRRMASSNRRIAAPTLIVWGEQDVALVPELAEGLEDWVPDLRVVRVPDSGHWVQQERPELVNRELLTFLSVGRAG